MTRSAHATRQDTAIAACMIFGHRNLQNALLARLIEEHLGLACAIRAPEDARLCGPQQGVLALLDAGASSQLLLEAQVLDIHEQISVIAVFNSPAGQAFDRLLRWPKVRGLFYENTGEAHFLQGIQSLSSHEHWLPRKVLAAYLEETRCIQHHPNTCDASLTAKETQILRAMISGAKNAEIAQVLHVSPHTIKTHVYNLFRKIKVNNRVQAVSWALVNFEWPQ